MKRLLLLLPLVAMLIPIQAEAQVPRTVLAEMCSATW
jgi:hypothetical protein